MKLEVDCTWNQGKNKAKLIIKYDFLPKKIFSMPEAEIIELQRLAQTAKLEGPNIFKKLKIFTEKYPKSLYANAILYQTLAFFEYEDEAILLFENIKKSFPKEVFTRCIEASYLLKNKKIEEFLKYFKNTEVLKGVFPRRNLFYFEEALFFHNLWIQYYSEIKDEIQMEKHKRFNLLMLNMLQSISLTKI